MARQKTECSIEGELIVKQLLEERGLLMKDFAEMIGISRESLTRALKGNPQYSTLKAIADGLGVSVPELFKESDTFVKKTTEDIHGCIFIGGESYLVSSRKDLEELVDKINTDNYFRINS